MMVTIFAANGGAILALLIEMNVPIELHLRFLLSVPSLAF